MPMQACITMANAAASLGPQHHAQHPNPDLIGALTDEAGIVMTHPCSEAVCSMVEGIADQLTKQPTSVDIIKALFLSVLFCILPVTLTHGSYRRRPLFTTPHLKLPPSLRFRVLLI